MCVYVCVSIASWSSIFPFSLTHHLLTYSSPSLAYYYTYTHTQINTDFDKEDLGLPKGHKILRTLQDVEAMAAAFRASPLFTSSCPSSSSSTSASSGVWREGEEETKMAVVVVGEEEGGGKYGQRMETLESLGDKKKMPSW